MNFLAHLAELIAGFLLAIYGTAAAVYALVLIVRWIDAIWLKLGGHSRPARR